METLVPIIMGSRSDMEHAQKIEEALEQFSIDCELRIGSAHKTPEHILRMIQAYEADPRPKVYITIAGRSNALSAFVDGSVSAPVIACPPVSNSFGGADIFSSLRMPGGVAPAVVLDPAGAALLAAKILSLVDPVIGERVAALQKSNKDTIMQDDTEIQKTKDKS